MIKFIKQNLIDLFKQEKILFYVYGSFLLIDIIEVLLINTNFGVKASRIISVFFMFITTFTIPVPFFYTLVEISNPFIRLLTYIPTYLFVYMSIYLSINYIFKNKNLLFRRQAFYCTLFTYLLINSYFIEVEALGNIYFILFPLFILPLVLIYTFDVEKILKR